MHFTALLASSLLASSRIVADGLGPGGYWMFLVFLAAVLVAALLFLVGLVALVVWLIRRRRSR